MSALRSLAMIGGLILSAVAHAQCVDPHTLATFRSASLRPDLCFEWQGGLQSRFRTKSGKILLEIWDYRDPSSLDRLLVGQNGEELDSHDFQCLMRLLSGDSTCSDASYIPQDVARFPRGAARDWDALQFGRTVLKDRGAVTARDELAKLFIAQDDSHGEFSKNIAHAARDANFSIPDSIDHLPRERKHRIFIGLANGFVAGQSNITKAFNRFRDRLLADGFMAEILPTLTYDDPLANARRIAHRLNDVAGDVDTILLLGASKGVSELAMTINDPKLLKSATLDKIRLLISMAGVIRYSIAARWIIQHYDRWGSLFMHQAFEWTLGPDYWQGLVGLATDSWPGHDHSLRKASDYSHLLWLSIASLPGLDTGLPPGMGHMKWIQKSVLQDNVDQIGPFDDVIESGASVLPPDTGVTQWIAPLLATHFVMEGRFLNGQYVSNFYQEHPELSLDQRYSQGAIDLQNVVLRSTPAEILNR